MGRIPNKEKIGDTIHVRLSDDMKFQLEREAQSRGIYMSQLIRHILMDYIEFLQSKERGETFRESTPNYGAVSIQDVLISDEFKDQLQKEIQKALKKMIE